MMKSLCNERLSIESQTHGYYWEEDKTIHLSIEEFIDLHGKGYPVISSFFCGAVNRAFFPLASKLISENRGQVMIITINKLQTDFIKSFLSTHDLDCLVMEESVFSDKCKRELGFCDDIYNNIRYFLVYSAEDIPHFVGRELFFNLQSFWQFVDKSQILPIWKGKWIYPPLNDYIDCYNVGILGNENILRFTTYLFSSKMPADCVNDGHIGPKPYLLKIDNQWEWILSKIKESQSKSIAILFQRDRDVRNAYQSFIQNGVSVEVKYDLGEEKMDNVDFNSDTPKVLTYYCSKGLLFDTVIMPMESNFKMSKRLTTIAASTAYNRLFVIYDKMPDMFREIPSSLYNIEYG